MAIGRTTRTGAAPARATRVTRPTVEEWTAARAPRAKGVGGPIVPAAPAVAERAVRPTAPGPAVTERAVRPTAPGPAVTERAARPPRERVVEQRPARQSLKGVTEPKRVATPAPVAQGPSAGPVDGPVAQWPVAGPVAGPVAQGPVAGPVAGPASQWPSAGPVAGPASQWPSAGPVAGPVVLGALGPQARAGWMERWPTEQVIARLRDQGEVYTSAAYEMGEALRELGRPERYRDELGHGSLEELLFVRGLPCRSTAHKLSSVVTTYSLGEVRELGGMEKCYWLIRGVKRQDPAGDARSVLEPGARVMGLDVHSASARQLREAQRRPKFARGPGGPGVGGPDAGGPVVGGPGVGGPVRGPVAGAGAGGPGAGATGGTDGMDGTDMPDPGAARRAGARWRSAMRRAAIVARIRVHHEKGKPCVSGHFDVASALQLVEIVRDWLRRGPAPP